MRKNALAGNVRLRSDLRPDMTLGAKNNEHLECHLKFTHWLKHLGALQIPAFRNERQDDMSENPSQSFQMTAFIEGLQACNHDNERGGLTDNPYRYDGAARDQWYEGYRYEDDITKRKDAHSRKQPGAKP